MKNFTIIKKDLNLLSCVSEVPSSPRGIVIVIHGFASSKECATYKLLLRRLPAAGFGMIGIELPGHGTAESSKELLSIKGAIDSIQAAEEYALSNYPGLDIFYFASSFGAYLTGLYISTREHKGRAAFFRSAAINMPELFIKDDPDEEAQKLLEDLRTQGYFDKASDEHRSVRITIDTYNEFAENDLFQIFDPDRFGPHSIMMAHGEEDSVIDPEAAKRFAAKFDIPIRMFPSEGHSLSNDLSTPEKVADLTVALYDLAKTT